MFTIEVGAKLSLTFWLGDEQIKTAAVVATRYPQVGNGLDFIDISPSDRLKLNEFITTSDAGTSTPGAEQIESE